jgi:predicted nucleotidyltransferase
MTITETVTPAFPNIDLEKPVPNEAIHFVVKRIVERFSPDKVILFGSHAYGEPKPWSDVDLLVVMDTQLTPRQQRLEISRFLRDRTFGIDIIVRTPADLADRVANRDYFLKEIVTRGKVIYARTNS